MIESSERYTDEFGSTVIPERIWAKLRVSPSGCWEWTGATTRGYGCTRMGGRDYYTHRLVWILLVGPIPEGYEIDHLCRNTRCANPSHLEPVTPAENRRREMAVRPRQLFCKNGHPRVPENLTGARNCKTCLREQQGAKRKPAAEVTECARGHAFTPANTYYRPNGTRTCRACRSARARRSRAKARDHRPTETTEETNA